MLIVHRGLLLLSFCMETLSSDVLRRNYTQDGWAHYIQPAILDNFSKRILAANADDRVSPGQGGGGLIPISSSRAARAGGSNIEGPKNGALQEALQIQAEGQ